MGYIGGITHLLTIDPNFLGHPSGISPINPISYIALYHSVPSHILFGIIHMEVAIDDTSIFGGLFRNPRWTKINLFFLP